MPDSSSIQFHSPDFIQRRGIVLSKENVPYDSALVFNAGVVHDTSGYRMLFRNDHGFCRKDFDDFYAGISDNTVPKTNIGFATSRDGIAWTVEPDKTLQWKDGDILRIYDPRLLKLEDGRTSLTFALDTYHGTRCGIAVTEDYETFSILSVTVPENRNIVLFPNKINGKWIRLERPFAATPGCHSAIWLSESPDLVHWGESTLLLPVEKVPFASAKLGPAAPPVLTDKGWLVLFHAVQECHTPLPAWERNWTSRYCCGAMLLDIENPRIIRAMAETPLLVPETPYELDGFRGSVIFPCTMLAESDGSAKIYYGAADTCVCLATTTISQLVDFCLNGVKFPTANPPRKLFAARP